MYNNVDIRKGYYGRVHYDSDGKEKYFERKGNAVSLDEICQSIESNDVIWRVSFSYLGVRQYFELERQKISDKKLLAELQGKGADITSSTFNCFVDSMRYQESQVQNTVNTYRKVGWIKIPVGDKLLYHFRCHRLVGALEGEYTGNMALTPTGKFDLWREMVLNDVLGRPPLELVLVASLSAIVNGLIANVTTGENPILHICSESGCGKSTAAFVAASVFGTPFEGGKTVPDKYSKQREVISVLGSWAATENAVIAKNSGNHGVVAIMNEIGKFKGKDMTNIIYSLSEGTDKIRLNEKYHANVNEGFATTIISIGESSLLDKCQIKAKGLDIRVMELTDKFTDSAEHSRRLKIASRANSGWAAQIMAEYILDNLGVNGVLKIYNRILDEETQNAPNEKQRFIEKFTALFLATAEIASYSLNIPFSKDSIREYCDKFWNNKTSQEGNVCRSFEEAVEYFEINKGNFYTDDEDTNKKIPKPVWGRIREPRTTIGNKKLLKEYAVYSQILKDFLVSKGYNNPTTELKCWRDKGALSCDANHLTSKYKIDPCESVMLRVYVLQVWEEITLPSTNRKPRRISKLLRANDDDKCNSEDVNKEVVEDEISNR